MSSVVVDLVETTIPVLERLVSVLDIASTAPQKVFDDIRRSAQVADEQVSSLREITGLLDNLLQRSASGDARSASEDVPEADRPPTSNRGVRNVPPRSKKHSISAYKSKASDDSNGRAKK